MDRWRRWETQAIRESRLRPSVSKQQPRLSPRPSARSSEPDDRVGTGELEADSAPGTMMVPVDAWNRVIEQLGNLHEAGQHLAEARERAARAETESAFLRERLAEMRAERSAADTESATGPPAASGPERPGVIRSVYRELRRLRR